MLDSTAIVLLAAGQSKRFGEPKMHHVLQSGHTLLETAVGLFSGVGAALTVVVQDKDTRAVNALQHQDVNVVRCVDAHLGMSASIKAGVSANAHYDAVMIALADMIYLQPQTLRQLCHNANSQKIIMPRSTDQRGKARAGNPVVFGQKFIAQLLELNGDKGGKSVCRDNTKFVHYLDVNDSGIFHDIDTPADVLPS